MKGGTKRDGHEYSGPRAKNSGKSPFPGVLPGTAGVGSQENPRRQRRQDYTPTPQPRETGVRY